MAAAAAAVMMGVAGCGHGGVTTTRPASTPQPSVPAVSTMPPPDQFVGVVDNPWMPCKVGTEWRFVGHTSDGVERTVVTVTPARKTILGVRATVVHDVVRLNGRLLEDTYDWYAQDRAGNVWYLGEDTKEYPGGPGGKVDTSGSWTAGEHGARAGVAMPAQPRVGLRYYQEFYAGEAEDAGEVLSTAARASVPYGDLRGLLMTHDFTRLEPRADEHKYYAKGVGVVLEVSLHQKDRTELVSMTRP